MSRRSNGIAWSALLAVALIISSSVSCSALALVSPTEGQIVRENVKIQLPLDAVPDDPQMPGFISIYVTVGGEKKFVEAIGRREAKKVGNTLVFYWNSKAPYFEPKAGKTSYLKDGICPLLVQVHDIGSASGGGKVLDSATVQVNVKNKVARTDPAPGVRLTNKLVFGQSDAYDVHAAVEVFDSVGAIDLPILGGLGITSDFTIFQSVEDVRPNGDLLMRYRVGEDAFVSSFGQKQPLYQQMQFKPQLYSLVSKQGTVLNQNLFTKQARFSIMGLLPALPGKLVKQGDTWPDTMRIKIDGLTEIAKFDGMTSLDSFEWQDGKECAKMVSQKLSGEINLSILEGKVQTGGPGTAEVTTWFAYKTGRMVRREINLDLPAVIAPDAGDAVPGGTDYTAPMSGPPSGPIMPGPSVMPYGDEDEGPIADSGPRPRPGPPGNVLGPGAGAAAKEAGYRKGKVKISVVIRLGK